jgi:hypothetical protein
MHYIIVKKIILGPAPSVKLENNPADVLPVSLPSSGPITVYDQTSSTSVPAGLPSTAFKATSPITKSSDQFNPTINSAEIPSHVTISADPFDQTIHLADLTTPAIESADLPSLVLSANRPILASPASDPPTAPPSADPTTASTSSGRLFWTKPLGGESLEEAVDHSGFGSSPDSLPLEASVSKGHDDTGQKNADLGKAADTWGVFPNFPVSGSFFPHLTNVRSFKRPR